MKKVGLMAVVLSILIPPVYAGDKEVNIYSYRQPFLIEPITEVFTE